MAGSILNKGYSKGVPLNVFFCHPELVPSIGPASAPAGFASKLHFELGKSFAGALGTSPLRFSVSGQSAGGSMAPRRVAKDKRRPIWALEPPTKNPQ